MPSLHDLLTQATPSQESTGPLETSVLSRLTRILASILDRESEEIQATVPLSDLGTTSLDIIELAVRVELELKIRTEEAIFHEDLLSKSLSEIASLIDSRQPQPSGDDQAS